LHNIGSRELQSQLPLTVDIVRIEVSHVAKQGQKIVSVNESKDAPLSS
jgi:hypothetical protein